MPREVPMKSHGSDGSDATTSGAGAMVWSSRIAVLAQIGEVVAAAAVVISLVYVGRELRSNTAAIRGSTVQQVTISTSQSLLTAASDSTLARIMRVGRQDPSRLTGPEEFRREAFMRQFWLLMQNVYLQNELGTIEPRAWTVYHRIICDVWDNPGGKESWSIHRRLMDEGFARLVESCP